MAMAADDIARMIKKRFPDADVSIEDLAGGHGVVLDALVGPRPAHATWFGEDQGRYVIAADPDKADAIHKAAAAAKVPLRLLGRVGGDAIVLDGEPPLPLATLKAAHEGWLPHFMAHG